MYLMFQALAKGSWKAPLILCFVIIAGGLTLQNSINSDIADQEAALRLEQPAPVSLDVFNRKTDIHLAKEVHVTARMNTDYNYRLIEERDGRKDKIRYMYVFFGPSQAKSSKQARAAVILNPEDKDAFVDLLLTQSAANFKALLKNETTTAQANLYNLAGTRDLSPDLRKIANQAFDEQGLKKGPNFIYIEPFLEGRVAGLTPDYELLSTWKYMWGSLLAIFAVITAIKFLRRHKWQEKRDAELAAKAYQKAAKAAAKQAKRSSPHPMPEGQFVSAPTSTRALETTSQNGIEQLLSWARQKPVTAVLIGLFVILLVLPGRLVQALPFMFVFGFVAIQFRHEIRKLFNDTAPAKGTLPDGTVLAEPEQPSAPKYTVPPVATSLKTAPKPQAAPTAAKPRPTNRKSVLNRSADRAGPVVRKKSLSDRLSGAFSSKPAATDPFRRLHRG